MNFSRLMTSKLNVEIQLLNTKNDKTEINLNALLKSMVEGMILQDISGKIIQHNPAALDILGLTEDQITNIDSIDYHEGTTSNWETNFPRKNHPGMESLKTGKIQKNIILRIFRYDGEMRWISLNAVPILNNDNMPFQLICTFTDISEMKSVLNELKQVQLLFNISHDIMIIANQEGYFKRINPRFSELLGYDLNEILSQKFLNFVHEEDLTKTQLELKKLSEKKEAIHFINRYRAKTNAYRIFDWVVVPDTETNLIYFTARDITDYRAEELDIIHSSKFYSIGELTSGIAFLLNGQLSIISGHISFIQSSIEQGQISTQELKEKIKSIDESIWLISKTTKELTSFAHYIENEKFSNISLNNILENIVSLCKERFRIHSVRLEIKTEGELIIDAKESQIANIIMSMLNMAYNAVHSQRDSWVEVKAKARNGVVTLIITSSNLTAETYNQKLLNITKGIVEENCGSFSVDLTSPNARFVIEFPEALKNS